MERAYVAQEAAPTDAHAFGPSAPAYAVGPSVPSEPAVEVLTPSAPSAPEYEYPEAGPSTPRRASTSAYASAPPLEVCDDDDEFVDEHEDVACDDDDGDECSAREEEFVEENEHVSSARLQHAGEQHEPAEPARLRRAHMPVSAGEAHDTGWDE